MHSHRADFSVFTTWAIATTSEYSTYPWRWVRHFKGNKEIDPGTREKNGKESSQKPGPPSLMLMLSFGIVCYAYWTVVLCFYTGEVLLLSSKGLLP